MKLNQLTLKEALDKLEGGEITLQEIYQDLDQAFLEKNKDLNIYLTKNEEALAEAESLKETLLKGLPIAVKDNFCTKGLRTTASSKVLDNFIPQYESTVTSNLKKNGGVIYGKTNMDAWLMDLLLKPALMAVLSILVTQNICQEVLLVEVPLQ